MRKIFATYLRVLLLKGYLVTSENKHPWVCYGHNILPIEKWPNLTREPDNRLRCYDRQVLFW